MSTIQYNLQFEKLCTTLKLGKMVQEPKAISGGLLHRMYSLKTSNGKYAVKALNPQIMLRPMVLDNYILSERIVNIAAKTITAVPAIMNDGTAVVEIDKQYYLVFHWVEGKCLTTSEINLSNCEKMGALIADIHLTNFSELNITKDSSTSSKLIDWNYYLTKGLEENAEWSKLIAEYIDDLYYWNEQANKAVKLLSSHMVISHRDLDPKNVMWHKDTPIIIDWESASYINPMHDLIETALYWSVNEKGNIDKEKFLAFIGKYKKRCGKLNADWITVLANGLLGKLEWLEYSLKRSLWIECTDKEEQQMGTTQVIGTLINIKQYAEMVPILEKWLKSEI